MSDKMVASFSGPSGFDRRHFMRETSQEVNIPADCGEVTHLVSIRSIFSFLGMARGES
jgi:hypothetical protein